jgi:hypothetical protein
MTQPMMMRNVKNSVVYRQEVKELICNISMDCTKVRRDQWEQKYIKIYYKHIQICYKYIQIH